MAVKKLSELTVAELKHELKKRKLDYTGDRAILLSRLRKSLVEDANKAKLAQLQKAKEMEEEKKSAEEIPVEQKKTDDVAEPTSVSEEIAVSKLVETDSSLNLKNLDGDIPSNPIQNSNQISAADATAPVVSVLESDVVSKEEQIVEQQQEPITTEIENVTNITQLSNVDVVPPTTSIESQVVETSVSTSCLKDEGVEKEDEIHKMGDQESKVVEGDVQTQSNLAESVPDAMDCKEDKDIGTNVKLEDEVMTEPHVDSEPRSDAANDPAKMELSEDVVQTDDKKIKEEETMEVQQSELVRKTEAEKPETSENVTLATTAVVPKINETKTPTSSVAAVKPASQVNSLWISGMVGVVKASDLKQAFNQYGRVVSAKIVTSAKSPGSRCFGLVTMHSHEDALRCINGFNGKMLLGCQVNVELDTKQRVTRPQAQVNRQAESIMASSVDAAISKPQVTDLPQTIPCVSDTQNIIPPISTTTSDKPLPQPIKQNIIPPTSTTTSDQPASQPIKQNVQAATIQSESSKPKQPVVVVQTEDIKPPVVAASTALKTVVPQAATTSKSGVATAMEKQDVSTSVWLSGFPSSIKAAELKAFCLSAGKVLAAKVVANAKLQTFYGLVTMATVDDANNCLKKLHDTFYNTSFKITCEMSPSNSVTPELLKHFSKNKSDQASQSAAKTTVITTKTLTTPAVVDVTDTPAPKARATIIGVVTPSSGVAKPTPSGSSTTTKATTPSESSTTTKPATPSESSTATKPATSSGSTATKPATPSELSMTTKPATPSGSTATKPATPSGSSTAKPATSSESTTTKPSTTSVKPTTSSSNTSTQKKPEGKNGGNKKQRKRAPLMKMPQGANRGYRRPSPKGRSGGMAANRYSGGLDMSSNRESLMLGSQQMMNRFMPTSRSILDDRRSLVYLEEERRLTQEMAMINAQREKLQIETLRLEREREKMEAERIRQDQLALQRRTDWKPILPMKRPHEQEEICWRPPPHSSAKRFAGDYDALGQVGRRPPPLLGDRDVRHLDRNMSGQSLLGPRGSFTANQNRFQDYY